MTELNVNEGLRRMDCLRHFAVDTMAQVGDLQKSMNALHECKPCSLSQAPSTGFSFAGAIGVSASSVNSAIVIVAPKEKPVDGACDKLQGLCSCEAFILFCRSRTCATVSTAKLPRQFMRLSPSFTFSSITPTHSAGEQSSSGNFAVGPVLEWLGVLRLFCLLSI